MRETGRSAAGDALTELILGLFQANNLILTWGDRLVGPLGLTSARWQILGAIALAEYPRPVAWMARDMGAHRQNVQRLVNELASDGLVRFEPNPHHRRAHLVVLTDKGSDVFRAAMALYGPRADAIAKAIPTDDLAAAVRVLNLLKTHPDLQDRDAEREP